MSDPPFIALASTVVEATATIAFALSGLLEAARKRLDAVGVCVVTATGLRAAALATDFRLPQWSSATRRGD